LAILSGSTSDDKVSELNFGSSTNANLNGMRSALLTSELCRM